MISMLPKDLQKLTAVQWCMTSDMMLMELYQVVTTANAAHLAVLIYICSNRGNLQGVV